MFVISILLKLILDDDVVDDAELAERVFEAVSLNEIGYVLYEKRTSRQRIGDFRKLVEIFIDPIRSSS